MCRHHVNVALFARFFKQTFFALPSRTISLQKLPLTFNSVPLALPKNKAKPLLCGYACIDAGFPGTENI